DSGGGQQLLPNGDVLVVETQGGRVLEVARGSGNRIVWEYVNLQEEGLVGQISNAQHVVPDRLTFLGQGCGQAVPGEPSGMLAIAPK
ncbi:MAG TPA: hypothetical protein VFY87_14695, partial [Geminicoccaceae bacterium]|nr:hypothetical protein [Geminicoccaceae bacterium]